MWAVLYKWTHLLTTLFVFCVHELLGMVWLVPNPCFMWFRIEGRSTDHHSFVENRNRYSRIVAHLCFWWWKTSLIFILIVTSTWSMAVQFPDTELFILSCISYTAFILVCQAQLFGTHKNIISFSSSSHIENERTYQLHSTMPVCIMNVRKHTGKSDRSGFLVGIWALRIG